MNAIATQTATTTRRAQHSETWHLCCAQEARYTDGWRASFSGNLQTGPHTADRHYQMGYADGLAHAAKCSAREEAAS